jgi:hypothetical protein
VKQKDVVYLVIAAAIFVVVGYVGYTQFGPKKAAAKAVQAEVVGTIPSSFDSTALNTLGNTNIVKDFNSPVDLTGLNNTAPFGP